MLVTTERARQAPALNGLENDYLSALIEAASAAIEKYCGREFAESERTETYDGDGSRELFVRTFPLGALETVTVVDADETEYDGDGFRLDTRIGRIVPKIGAGLSRFPAGVQNLRVTYTGGFSTIPADVQEACVQTVQAMRGATSDSNDAGMQSERIGDYSYVRFDASTHGLTPSVKALLAPYRVLI